MLPSLKRFRPPRPAAAGAVVFLLAAAACVTDPVHDALVKQQGGEDLPPFALNEYHRAGQPCLICHGGKGPAKSEFAIAGTVYQLKYQGRDEPAPVPAADVKVTVVDASANQYTILTNCRGNFWWRKCNPSAGLCKPSEADIFYPFLTSISKGGRVKVMSTHVGRDGSCAACHKDPPLYDSPGRIYLAANEADLPGGKVEEAPCPPEGPPAEGVP